MIEKITTYYSKVHFFLFCALAMFPLTPRGVHSTLIIIIAAIAAFHFLIYGRKFWTIKKTIILLSLGSLCVLYVLSLLQANNFDTGSKMIVRTAPLLLLPFSFLSLKENHWSERKLNIILYIYVISVLIFQFYLHISFFEAIYDTKLSSWEIRSKIETKTKVHGTYLSIWIGFAILVVLRFLFNMKKRKVVVFLGISMMGYFFYWLQILGARMPFFATIIASVWLVLSLCRIANRTISIIYILLFFAGLLIFWKPISNKIEELANYEEAIPVGKYENTNPFISNENIRSVIYYCAFEKIKQKPLLGYGVGNVDNQLQECYDSEFKHTDLFTRFYFNAHSQYLQLLLTTGTLGLLVFLASIVFWIRESSYKLYLPFLILALLCFVFENILSRHDGIMFFAVFNTILFFFRSESKD